MSLLLPARPSAPVARKPRSAADEQKRLLRKAIAASAIGNATEWYDYGVYAVVATYLTEAFFPESLGNLGTMFGFAVSFVLRPLGGIIWGPIGDRFGRKSVLIATILLIAVATTLIGVLPTYATAGWWAPGLLIALRVVQGFSTGGEYGGAATFMAESAPDDKRGTYGSFLEFGAVGGFVLGSAVVLALEAMLSHEQMAAWGWRIPFLLALPLGLVGLVLRSRMDETPVFKECVACDAITGSAWDRLVDLLTNYTRPIAVTFALVVVLNIIDYTLVTYQPTYLHASAGLDERSRTTVVLVGELAMMACIPFAGAWSDRIGRKPLWRASLLGFAVLALPMYWLMGQGLGWALVGFTVLRCCSLRRWRRSRQRSRRCSPPRCATRDSPSPTTPRWRCSAEPHRSLPTPSSSAPGGNCSRLRTWCWPRWSGSLRCGSCRRRWGARCAVPAFPVCKANSSGS